jgi:hypothetical protein
MGGGGFFISQLYIWRVALNEKKTVKFPEHVSFSSENLKTKNMKKIGEGVKIREVGDDNLGIYIHVLWLT